MKKASQLQMALMATEYIAHLGITETPALSKARLAEIDAECAGLIKADAAPAR